MPRIATKADWNSSSHSKNNNPMHTLPIQIRFNDVDQMGHVNNAVIMEYFDLGKATYFSAAGIPVTPDEGDFCVLIVHCELDFLRQIRYADTVSVTTQVTHWGNKSLEVTQHVIANGQPAATCKTVMSGFSRRTQSAAVIPEDIKERVRRYEATL